MSVSPFDVDIACFKNVRGKYTSWKKKVKIVEHHGERSSYADFRLQNPFNFFFYIKTVKSSVKRHRNFSHFNRLLIIISFPSFLHTSLSSILALTCDILKQLIILRLCSSGALFELNQKHL
jgi:hypothetical protein